MATLSSVLELLQNVVFVAVGLWALVRWRRDPTEQRRWLAATFLTLAAAITTGIGFEAAGFDPVPGPAVRVIIGLLALFPWVLLQFLDSFEPVSTTFRRVVAALTGVVVVAGFLLPTLPGPDETPDPPFTVYLVAFLVLWTMTLSVVAFRFWRAGRGQPEVVRKRLRLLALATAALSLALLVASGQGPEPDVSTVVLQVISLLSAFSFLVGFAPPGPLRVVWREASESRLHDASVHLMAATSPAEVASLLAPHARESVGASAVVLVQDGEVLVADGAVDQIDSLVDGDGAAWSYPLSSGALHVWSNPYTPFFGDEEAELLQRATVLADLALARIRLLENEEQARRELQQTNGALEDAHAELEVFTSSVTHDLKTPLTTIRGFLDLLDRGVGGELDEDGRHFVARMSHNAMYMQELIADLLELFRVGQADASADEVDLGTVVREAAHRVLDGSPDVQVVVGALPVVWMNELQCRQLFHNLLGNAAAHNDGAVRVEVVGGETADGLVEVLVRDDGVGVPAADRERVFGVFERGTRDGDGTGIGLAICRKIVDRAGGSIELTGREPGAEFRLRLPRAEVSDGVVADGAAAHLGITDPPVTLERADAGWSSPVSSPGS